MNRKNNAGIVRFILLKSNGLFEIEILMTNFKNFNFFTL